MADLKDHTVNVSISTILTLIPVITAVWFVGKPILVSQISDAMGAEFEDTIQEKTAPVENAFKALLRSEITKLRKEIAKLETHQGDDEWAEDDAEYLAELRIELEALQEAYNEL